MTDLTGRTPANTYKDLLQVSNSNSGIDGTLRAVEDGEATASPLELSSSAVNVSSGFQLGGTALTATAAELNAISGGVPNPASLLLNEVSAPATPASGKLAVYAKTDGKLYIKDDEGTETDLTAAGGGGGLGALLQHTDVSGTPATVDMTTGLDTTYDMYVAHYHLVGVNDAQHLVLRASTDGGSSFADGASDYRYALIQHNDTSSGSSIIKSSGSTTILLANFVGSDTSEGVSGSVTIYKPHDTGRYTHFWHSATYMDNGGRVTAQHGASIYNATTAVNGLRFIFSSGAVESGFVALYGYNKS